MGEVSGFTFGLSEKRRHHHHRRHPMSKTVANITTARFRGEGLVYVGSLVEQRGAVVIGMSDCECAWCCQFHPWDEARRVTVNLDNGKKLYHARQSSFVRPDAEAQS